MIACVTTKGERKRLVITAVGMASEFWVMAGAIIIAVVIMLAAAKPLADFIERR